jgi:hypothetical protein
MWITIVGIIGVIAYMLYVQNKGWLKNSLNYLEYF